MKVVLFNLSVVVVFCGMIGIVGKKFFRGLYSREELIQDIWKAKKEE